MSSDSIFYFLLSYPYLYNIQPSISIECITIQQVMKSSVSSEISMSLLVHLSPYYLPKPQLDKVLDKLKEKKEEIRIHGREGRTGKIISRQAGKESDLKIQACHSVFTAQALAPV